MIRSATPQDVEAILGLVHELAVYENAPNEVVNTKEALHADLFEDKTCEAIVAEVNHQIVGFALFYTSYSTWRGKCLYLEDLYVQPAFRQQKIGKQLFDHVVNETQKRGYKRMDWQVLDWNTPAIEFYKKENAELSAEWLNGRLYF